MRSVTLMLGILTGTVALATDPSDIVKNEMLAESMIDDAIGEAVTSSGWTATLAASGDTKIYHQDLVIGSEGYSGWHTHPGVLLVTVERGEIDWYNSECERRSFEAGESFIESSEAHTVVNPSDDEARMLITYVVKADEPRRQEAQQPSCGDALGLL